MKTRRRIAKERTKKMFHGIGRLKNPETGEPILTHIEMNSDAKPVIQPPRPVPHHLEEKTKKKLDYFVQEGVMTWTKPGEPIMSALLQTSVWQTKEHREPAPNTSNI